MFAMDPNTPLPDDEAYGQWTDKRLGEQLAKEHPKAQKPEQLAQTIVHRLDWDCFDYEAGEQDLVAAIVRITQAYLAAGGKLIAEPETALADDEWRDLSLEESNELERAATLGVINEDDTPLEIVAERERATHLAAEVAREFPKEPGPRYVMSPCEEAASHGNDCYSVFRVDDPDDCVQAHLTYAQAYHFIYGVNPPPGDDGFTDEVVV